MRTIAIVTLSVALAVTIVAGVILYRRYHDVHIALMASEERVAESSEKLSQLSQETATLHDQLVELEDAKTRISELEHAIAQKDRAFSGLNKAIRTIKGELEKERKTTERMATTLTSRNNTIIELQEQLRTVQSRAHDLEEQLAEKHHELELTHRTLKGEKASADASIDELRSTYESLISDLKTRIEHQEVRIERFEEEISITFVERILFDFGKATVTLEGGAILNKIGRTLQTITGKKIRVIGHTDDRPIHPDYRDKFPSNWELSSARASSVVRYLKNIIGLDPANLEAVGRSFFDPVASNETYEGRARNRRVEIIIAPELE
jgi:chemotaxis protein MotB